MGSWGMRATTLPRWRCISFSDNDARSMPSSTMLPEAILPLPGRRRMTAKPDVVLPQPDSPTRPTHSPGEISSEKSSTAVANVSRVANWTFRLLTESSGGIVVRFYSGCTRGRGVTAAPVPKRTPRCDPGYSRSGGAVRIVHWTRARRDALTSRSPCWRPNRTRGTRWRGRPSRGHD